MHPALVKLGWIKQDRDISKLIRSIDFDNDKKITLKEFIKFYYLVPANLMRSHFDDFTMNSVLDMGEQASVVTSENKASALICLPAGAVAAIISRTLTAPIDRLKIIL